MEDKAESRQSEGLTQWVINSCKKRQSTFNVWWTQRAKNDVFTLQQNYYPIYFENICNYRGRGL